MTYFTENKAHDNTIFSNHSMFLGKTNTYLLSSPLSGMTMLLFIASKMKEKPSFEMCKNDLIFATKHFSTWQKV